MLLKGLPGLSFNLRFVVVCNILGSRKFRKCWERVAMQKSLRTPDVTRFYKPTIPQSPPSHLQDYSTCNIVRLEFSIIFVPSFDIDKRCLKNGLHSGGLNPGPLGHESSALTTRPRLFATWQMAGERPLLNKIKYLFFDLICTS
jgi:hypothetical protein